MIKVGILGTGFGKVHAEIYRRVDGFEIKAIFGRDRPKLEAIHADWGIPVTTSIEQVLDDPDIQLVDICLPSPLHRDIAIAALKAGKHVFCETPVTWSLAEAQDIQAAARKWGKLVFVDQFIKFTSAHAKAIQMARDGALGEIQYLEAHNQTAAVWGDLSLTKSLWNFHLHNLDFITEILGVPDSVSAAGANFPQRSALVTTCGYPEALAVATSLSNLPDVSPFGLGFQIIGDRASLRYEASFGAQSSESLIWQGPDGRRELELAKRNEYEAAIRQVGDCLQAGCASPSLDISRAIQSLEIAHQVQQTLTKPDRV